MRRQYLFLLGLCCALVLLSTQYSHAAIYKYLDKDGLICFANDLQSIPQQYRTSAMVVSGEADREKQPGMQTRPSAPPSDGNQDSVQNAISEKLLTHHVENSSSVSRWLLSAIVVVSTVFAFVILGILDTDHKKTVTVVRVVLLWAVAVYLLIAHAGDAIHLVRSVSGTIGDAKLHAEEKGKNAAKALKAINTLVDQVGGASSADLPEADREKKE